MPIEIRHAEAAAVIAISGRLVFGREAERLEAEVGELLKSGQTKFVFDLAALEYMDSSGIGTVVACLTQIKKAGAELRVAGASSRIQRLFAVTGVDKLLSLYPSVNEATS